MTIHDFECDVCMLLLVEPITLSCGHTFCRLCLMQALERCQKCPSCRSVCHIRPEDHPETLAISRVVRRLFPALVAARAEEIREEKEKLATQHPVFYYNLPIFVGETLHLHLFEPRYRLMMRRIVDSTRKFLYLPSYREYKANPGDVAMLAELRDVHFFRDGRAEIEAKIVGRYRVTSTWVEDGTGGLAYCRVEDMHDEGTAPERQQELEEAAAFARDKATALFLGSHDIRVAVVDRYGEMPAAAKGPEALSLWISAVLPMESREAKHRMLALTNTLERLTYCNARLQELAASVVGQRA